MIENKKIHSLIKQYSVHWLLNCFTLFAIFVDYHVFRYFILICVLLSGDVISAFFSSVRLELLAKFAFLKKHSVPY